MQCESTEGSKETHQSSTQSCLSGGETSADEADSVREDSLPLAKLAESLLRQRSDTLDSMGSQATSEPPSSRQSPAIPQARSFQQLAIPQARSTPVRTWPTQFENGWWADFCWQRRYVPSPGNPPTPIDEVATPRIGQVSWYCKRFRRNRRFLPDVDDEVVWAGPVVKRSQHLRQWRQRWGVLTAHFLLFFKGPNGPRSAPTTTFRLSEVQGVAPTNNNVDLTIRRRRANGTYVCALQFDEASLAESWACLILTQCDRCAAEAT